MGMDKVILKRKCYDNCGKEHNSICLHAYRGKHVLKLRFEHITHRIGDKNAGPTFRTMGLHAQDTRQAHVKPTEKPKICLPTQPLAPSSSFTPSTTCTLKIKPLQAPFTMLLENIPPPCISIRNRL